MKTSYDKAFYEDFLKRTKDSNCNYYLTYAPNNYAVRDFYNKYKSGNVDFPAIVMMTNSFEYVTSQIIENYQIFDSTQNCETIGYDYIHTIPMELFISFGVYTPDISQLAELENFLTSLYRNPVRLTVTDSDYVNRFICTDIMYDDQKRPIIRGQEDMGSRHIFYSRITLISTVCPSFTESYAPAQLELDKYVNEEIVERLSAIEKIKSLYQENNYPIKTEKISQLDQAWNNLDTLVNAVRGITDYQTLYGTMRSQNCSIEQAFDMIQKQVQEEKKKAEKEARRIQREKEDYEENARTILHQLLPQGTDDELLNQYTEAVAEDIRLKLSEMPEVQIVSGSKIMDWIKQYDDRKNVSPAVLIFSKMDYVFGEYSYTNVTTKGLSVTHNYNTMAFPIKYSVRIDIISEQGSDVERIEDYLKKAYMDNPVTIKIPDPRFPDEQIMLKISISKKIFAYDLTFDGWKKDTRHTIIYTAEQMSVYYIREYSQDQIENNPVLQLRLLQQAFFAINCFSKIHNDAIGQLDKDYKKLITRKSSFFDFLNAEDFRQLQNCFDTGKFIDPKLFNKVLSKIVLVYPNLYNKMMSGMTYEQIRSELEEYAEYFSQRWVYLCSLLSLPEDIGIYAGAIDHSSNMRSPEGLGYCIEYLGGHGLLSHKDYLSGSENHTLKGAIESYKKFLKRELEKYEERQEREREARANASMDDDFVGDFITGMLRTAGGVALGNRLSGNRGSRSRSSGRQNEVKKKNYYGSKACQRKSRVENGRFVHKDTCVGCTIASQCSHWR